MKWLLTLIKNLRIRRRINLCGPVRFGGNSTECREREGLFFGDHIVDWETVCGEYEQKKERR